MARSAKQRLSTGRKGAVLLVPWAFLGTFAFLYVTFLLPQVRSGQALAIAVSIFVAMSFVSFAIAAVTFSRDVLADRYPSS